MHKLLGGAFRSKLTPYATGFYRRRGGEYLEAGVEEAGRHLVGGFSAMKLKVGFGVEADIGYVRALREAVGPEVRIMMDANCAYDAPARPAHPPGAKMPGSTSSKSRWHRKTWKGTGPCGA